MSDAFAGVPVRSVYRGLYDTSTRGTELSLKLNHQAGNKDTLSTRYALSRGRVLHEVQGPENFADRSAQGSSFTLDHSIVGSWLRVLSPSLVNDVRIQFGQRDVQLRPNAVGPMLEIPGVATMGEFYRLNADRTERHYQVVENFNFVIGSHRLSAGVDAHAVTLNANFRNRYGALYIFPTVDDFLRGRPDMFIQAFGNPKPTSHTIPFGSWLQDRWELRPGLSLELGLRFDRQRMPARTSLRLRTTSRRGSGWHGGPPQRNRSLYAPDSAFSTTAIRSRTSTMRCRKMAGKDSNKSRMASRHGLRSPSPKAQRNPLPFPESRLATYSTSAAFPSSYGRKASLGMEYGIGKDTSLSIEASQLRGVHLPRIRNVAVRHATPIRAGADSPV